MSKYSEIGVETHGHVGLIEIRRPPLNFFDVTLINQIADALRRRVRDPQRQSIFLRADENVPFGAFATVMDAVKQSGITNVSIVTQPLEQSGSKR